MKLDELLSLLSKKADSYINQSQLAESLGVTRQTISNRIKNKSEVTLNELRRVEDYFSISLLNSSDNLQDDLILLDYYTNVFASCGNGNIVFSDEKKQMSISKLLIPSFSNNKSYSIINASGNSMFPTIESGDKLIVEHWNGDQIQDNKIYAFCFNNDFFVKRLAKNLDEIIIKSDNLDYRIKTINGETIKELTLIGKIVSIIKNLD